MKNLERPRNSKLEYYVLDVFTEKQFSGNQLSVVYCDDELPVDQYHHISKEFGYSETSFVTYSETESVFKVRSFTPSQFEVTGAGHNLLGAVCLALLKGWDIFRGHGTMPWVLMKDTKIPLVITKENNLFYVGMKQRLATVLPGLPTDELASAIGLTREDLNLNGWQNKVVETEVAHLMVPVKDGHALRRAIPTKQLLKLLSARYCFEGFYLFTTNHENDSYLAEARFFNPGIGIDEDPATGTAAGPLTGYLCQLGYVEAGKTYKILQGVSVGRPSVIDVQKLADGIFVSGSSVIVMEGVIHV